MASNIKEYGLIGFPLTHSFSKEYFSNKFKSEGIDAEYLNFEIDDIGLIMEIIAEHPNLMGFNVTIPYKEQILSYLTSADKSVDIVGAANVVKIERRSHNDIRLIGYNTDFPGFLESIKPLANTENKSALILGTGGASKAVAAALEELQFSYKKVSRIPNEDQLCYEELEEAIDKFYAIINTTPLGTFPDTSRFPPIPYHKLTPKHLCFDLIYNPYETEFLRKSIQKGATVKNGLEMLIRQAELSWETWNS